MTTFFTLDVDEGRREGQGLGARAEALRHARLQPTAEEREVGSNCPPGSESYHETLQMSAAYIAGLWIIHLFIGGQAMPRLLLTRKI